MLFVLTVLENIYHKNTVYVMDTVISIYMRQDHLSLILHIKLPFGFHFVQYKILELKHIERCKFQLMP